MTDTDRIVVDGPITIKELRQATHAIRSAGGMRALTIKIMPQQEMELRVIDGFWPVERYNSDQLDEMQGPGEIGIAAGVHVVVRWGGQAIKAPDGKFRSQVMGGRIAFFIDSVAQED